MAVEDHPLFPEWKSRLERLIEAKEALKEGRASQAEVDKAFVEYERITEEL